MIVETGSGVRKANSYVTVDTVTQYLTDRNRQTENNWASSSNGIKEAACIKATDYVEKKYSSLFRGSKRFLFSYTQARGSVSFTNNPENGNVLALGDDTYLFVTTLYPILKNQVQIASTLSGTLDNLISCIVSEEEFKYTRFSFSEESRHAKAEKSGNLLILTSLSDGSGGNSTILSTTVSNTTVTQFTGGVDGGPQVLSFPRIDAFYDSGEIIEDVPQNLKYAVCEYAVRSLVSPLIADPEVDNTGQITRKLEKIGPIETEIAYLSGSYGSSSFKPYPEADLLLKPLLKSNSFKVIRG